MLSEFCLNLDKPKGMAFPPNPIHSQSRIQHEFSHGPTLKIKLSGIPGSEIRVHTWFSAHTANLILSGQFRFIMYA